MIRAKEAAGHVWHDQADKADQPRHGHRSACQDNHHQTDQQSHLPYSEPQAADDLIVQPEQVQLSGQ